MAVFIRLHLDKEETLVNIELIVQIKPQMERCEIITMNGVVRPDENCEQVKGLLRAARAIY